MIPFSPSYRNPKSSFLAPIALIGLMWIAGCGLVGNDDKKPRLPGTLVFSAMDDSGEYQIYSMRPDGSRLKRLTDPDFEFGPGEGYTNPFGGLNPSWSPDGTQIVFSTSFKATTIGPSLWVMNEDGSDPQPLHNPEPDNIHSFPLPGNHPRWCPDGTKVTFDLCVNCQVSTNYAVFVFDLETKEGERLTQEPPGHSSMYPTWSPDGNRIAFESNRDYISAETDRFRQELYIMDDDGSNQTRITETGHARSPIWHPDAMSIAFKSFNSTNSGLYSIDLQSGELSLILAESPTFPGLQPHAWSADGRYLLFSTWQWDSPFAHTLYSLDSQTSEIRKLFTKHSNNSNPAIMGVDWK